eukprot:scaffold95290_cov32-Attheya_sp.AAC.2
MRPLFTLDWRTTALVSGRPLLCRHVQRRHIRAFPIVEILMQGGGGVRGGHEGYAARDCRSVRPQWETKCYAIPRPVSPRERRGWPLCKSVLQLGTGRVQPGMRPRLPTSGREGRHYALH